MPNNQAPYHADFYKRGQYGPKFNNALLNQMLFYVNNRARAEFKVPGSMFQISKDGRLYLTKHFMGMLGYRVNQGFVTAMTRLAAKASTRVVQGPAAFAAGLAAATGDEKSEVTQINQIIAARMRQAVRQNYGRVVGRRAQVPSYRIGQGRYAGGALRRALGASDLAVGTSEGIQYVNQDRLNLEARHWARLNFGVAPASTPAPYEGRLRFGGTQIGVVGFKASPRPPMFLPAGWWMFPTDATGIMGKISAGPRVVSGSYERQYRRTLPALRRGPNGEAIYLGINEGYQHSKRVLSYKGGQPEINNQRGWRANYGSYTKSGIRRSQQGFYPLRGAPRYPTRGIVGTNYLDIGFQTMVEQFELEYGKMFLRWLESATNTQKTSSPAGQGVVNYILSLNLKPDDPVRLKTEFIEKHSRNYGFKHYYNP